ncbi:MAG TPA: aquaporin Z [Candidatus Limnocylindrales bacterium]|nr:aquaporin Z [Candidatus Limnocylindrales bacterium]
MSEKDEWKMEEEKMSKEEKATETPVPSNVMPQITPMKKYVAELIGTMVLVLIGCGSAVMVEIAGSYLQYNLGYIGIAFAFGIALLTMVYAIGGISGCHINPAVSISMWIAGKISSVDTVFYIIFQCIGAIIGAGLLDAIVRGTPYYRLSFGLGQNGYGSASPAGFSLAAVFLAEVVLTFVFLIVIHGATSERAPKGFAGLAIGLSLTMIHLVGIPVDGTSVNPARSLGPALFVGGTALSQVWVFIVAPIIGGIIAAFVWKFFK